MFAQASTFPSRPATDSADIRPHLVALRDTLVLMDDNEDSEFEIHINSVDDEDNELEDDSEEDEDGDDDPCLSEPDLPECNVDEEEEPPTIM